METALKITLPTSRNLQEMMKTAFKLCVDMIRTVDNKKKPKKVYRYSPREFYKALRMHVGCKTITDEEGLNLLAIIILEGRIDLLGMLSYCGILLDMLEVKISSEVNSSYSGMTAREIIDKYNMTEMRDELEKLLRLEASLTPQHEVARIGDVDAMKFALEHHPEMMEIPGMDGSKPLLWAVTSGNLEVVQMLVSHAWTFESETLHGETILGRAVYCGHLDIIMYLIKELLLDPDQVCRDGSTPIEIALENFDLGMFQVLIECGAKISNDILLKVASLGRLDFWKNTCAAMRDVNVDHKDKYGKSSLYIAVEKNHKGIVKDIMKMKGDLKGKDRWDGNILFAAIDSGSEDMFQYVLQLLKSGRLLRDLINKKDLYCGKERLFIVKGRHNGTLGYHFVEVRRIYLDIFPRRIRQGRPMDVAKFGEVLKSGWGSPPQAEWEEMQKKYDSSLVNPADRLPDMTPLHYAILKDQTEMAVNLILEGADVNAKDCFENQPVHIAAMRGDLDVLRKLEEYKIDLNIPGDQGYTPFQIAEDNHHAHVCNFIEGAKFIDEYGEAIKAHNEQAGKKLDDLHLDNLQKERQRGTDIRQYIISRSRDMRSEFALLLYNLGTTPIQQASSE